VHFFSHTELCRIEDKPAYVYLSKFKKKTRQNCTYEDNHSNSPLTSFSRNIVYFKIKIRQKRKDDELN
jgi:hypothetical protein